MMDFKIQGQKTGQTFGPIQEEQSNTNKIVYTIYGDKGVGKTTCAFGLEGSKAVLSFDRKSMRVKEGVYNNDLSIHVYDCLKYYEPGEKTYTESSSTTFDYALHILESLPEDTDWVVVDGLERLTKICEMRMRFKENVEAFKGFANMGLWKLRRLYIRQIHEKAIAKARKGVVYTTYPQKDELIADGDVTLKRDVPKWIDIVMEETDVVVHVKSDKGKDGNIRYLAHIESSKLPLLLKSGSVQDITNGRLMMGGVL